MFQRYAIFYTAPTGPLADFGANWLGWDSARGCSVPHPEVPGLDVAALTRTPRKYGFHGTLKAPFRLAETRTEAQLGAALEAFAGFQPVVTLDTMALGSLRGFLALRPAGDAAALNSLATTLVTEFDDFRAPLSEADIARRNPDALDPDLRDNLMKWGYPYIFGAFNFHLTLTGKLADTEAERVIRALAPLTRAVLPTPFPIDAVTLMGEDGDGMFHALHRYPFSG